MNTAETDIRFVFFTDDQYRPCRSVETCLQAIVDELPGAALERIDAWKRPDLVIHHRVMTVPSVVLMIDGNETLRLAGPRSERSIRRLLARHLDRPVAVDRPRRRLLPVG